MFNSGIDVLTYDRLRREEFLKEAEQSRLLQDVQKTSSSSVSLLTNIFVLLVSWKI